MGYTFRTRNRVLDFLREEKRVAFSELMYLGEKGMQVKGTTLHEVLEDLSADGLVEISRIKTRKKVIGIEVKYLGGKGK